MSRYRDIRTHYRIPADISGQVKWRFLPDLKAGVSTPRFR